MAREKHLTSVHIGNFKRFRGLQVDNLGQFNLVVGDNNTGKTSFLEALVLDEECRPSMNVRNLLKLLEIRQSVRVEKENTTDEDLVVSIYGNNQNSEDAGLSLHFTYAEYQSLVLLEKGGNNSVFSYVEEIANSQNSKEEFEIYFSHLKSGLGCYYYGLDTIIIDGLRREIPNSIGLRERSLTDRDLIKLKKSYSYLNFMPFGAGYDNDLIGIYKGEIDRRASRRNKLQDNLKLFIPSIADIRLQDGTIIIYEDEQDLGTPLYTYGEGAVKFFRILCYMAIAEGKRLMIDEIDTGIHHTKFVQFWKILIQAAKAYDVQLFATTHNEECLQYFQTAFELEELEEEREQARVILFRANKDESIVAQTHDYATLQEAEEMGYELRGRG